MWSMRMAGSMSAGLYQHTMPVGAGGIVYIPDSTPATSDTTIAPPHPRVVSCNRQALSRVTARTDI
jgi:hypothetical protein